MTASGRMAAVALIVVLASAAGGWWWWQGRSALPDGIATANGRIEAETVQIATRTGGRVLEVLVDEGDLVAPGQVLAKVDTSELEAMRRGAQAQEAAAREAVNAVLAQIVQRESELKFAEQALDRARTLLGNGHISQQEVDQRQTARETAAAARSAIQAQLANAENTVLANAAEVERISTLITDSTLTAPIAGRIQYRLAEPGEVVAAGGRVLTLLNLGDVYMTVFLPTASVGRVLIGAEARIVLDAAPEYVIPASVSFVAADAQFTPREVETRSERDKLMFRVKLQIEPDLLARHIDKVRTGLPGEAFVMMAPAIPWPPTLEVNLPDAR